MWSSSILEAHGAAPRSPQKSVGEVSATAGLSFEILIVEGSSLKTMEKQEKAKGTQPRYCYVCNVSLTNVKSYRSLVISPRHNEAKQRELKHLLHSIEVTVGDALDLSRCHTICDRCVGRVKVIQKTWEMMKGIKEQYHQTKMKALQDQEQPQALLTAILGLFEKAALSFPRVDQPSEIQAEEIQAEVRC